VNRAPRGSRPCGFDPRAHFVLLAGGTRTKGPPLCGVVITARRAGALLTGLATALAVGSRRAGVAITAPKAGAILPPPLRFGRPLIGIWTDTSVQRCERNETSMARETKTSGLRGRKEQSFARSKAIEHERQLIFRFGIGKA
jgi:hypothetical protein